VDFRKTFFILPNLFTLAGVFCGFFALTLCAGDADPKQLYQAALAICFGFFFDTFDGRLARLTRTQSQLGLQLDSLSDMITFGAAPAMMVYKWGMNHLGVWGIVVAYLYVAAGAMRLARFNTLTTGDIKEKPKNPGKYMLGLPIPAAAGVLVSLVIVHYKVGSNQVYTQGAIAALVVVLSYLMVSRVRFRSFKDVRLTRKTLGVVFLIVLVSAIIIMKLRASFIFVSMTSAYLALGLTEEVILFAAEQRRKRREARLAAGEELSPEDIEPTIDDAEVVRELEGDDEDNEDDEDGEGDDAPSSHQG
jgi:CDP-diacylglycerol--serine O-phosphatidyltransferase